MPKYSFIIPVYKTEKYIRQCVDSILAQTYQDYEIILVDDGSPDRSGEICDAYAAANERIRAIHIENSGASVARNTGLECALGDYIIFLDSDDYWYLADALEKIDRLFLPDVDIVVFPSFNYYESNGVLQEDRYDYPPDLNSMKPEECLEFMVTHDLLNMHAAKRAYRKGFLTQNELRFKPGIRAEDVELGFRVANALPWYRFLNERVYVYRQHSGSVTTSMDANHLYELAGIITEYAKYEYVNSKVRDLLLSYDAYQLSLLLAHLYKIPRQDQRKIMNKMYEYRFLFRYKAYPRTKQIARMYSAIGYWLTQKALSAYLKMK